MHETHKPFAIDVQQGFNRTKHETHKPFAIDVQQGFDRTVHETHTRHLLSMYSKDLTGQCMRHTQAICYRCTARI